MECTVSSGTSECAQTSCISGGDCTIDTADALHFEMPSAAQFETYRISCGLELATASDEWMSGMCRAVGTSAGIATYGGTGQSELNNSFFGIEGTSAATTTDSRLRSEATAKHMLARSVSAPAGSGETYTIAVMEEQSTGGLTCVFGDGDTSCTGSGSVTVEAGNEMTFEYEPAAGTMSTTNFCQATLWDSL